MTHQGRARLLGGTEPIIVLQAWRWMNLRYDAVADAICEAVFSRERHRPQFFEEHALYKECVHECFTCEGRRDCEPERMAMVDGAWVARELQDAIWERLRRVRRRLPWNQATLWHRVATVHAVIYQAFQRCATLRTHELAGIAVPVETPFQLIDRHGHAIELDFNDIPPARTFLSPFGAGR